MRPILRQVNAISAWLFVGAIVVQVFLAGSAIAQLGGSGNFQTHMDFGYAIGIFALIALLAAIGGGLPRRDIGIAFGILLLYFVQTSLPYLKQDLPSVAALHPVNAMLLFAISVWYARRAWRSRSHVVAPTDAGGMSTAGARAR
jgi:hypothetical protein